MATRISNGSPKGVLDGDEIIPIGGPGKKTITSQQIADLNTGGVWGSITGTLSDQLDLQSALDGLQDSIDDKWSLSSGGTLTGNNIIDLDGNELVFKGATTFYSGASSTNAFSISTPSDVSTNNIILSNNKPSAFTTGYLNYGIGRNLFVVTTTGRYNFLGGDHAGALITTGGKIVAIGALARSSTDGIGSNITSEEDVMLGYASGYSLDGISGQNFFGGGHCGFLTTNTNKTVLLGYNANPTYLTGVDGQLSIQNMIYGLLNTGSGTTDSTGYISIGAKFNDAGQQFQLYVPSGMQQNGANATNTASQRSSFNFNYQTSLWNGTETKGWFSWRADASVSVNSVQNLTLYSSTGTTPAFTQGVVQFGQYGGSSRYGLLVGSGSSVGMVFEPGVALRIGGIQSGGGWAIKFVDNGDNVVMGTILNSTLTMEASVGAKGRLSVGDTSVAFTNAITYLTSPVQTSSWLPVLRVDAPANTGYTATTEFISNDFRGASQQWLSGTVATQRFNYFKGFTVTGASATATFTDLYTLYVESSTAGSNAIITNNWALGVSGKSKFTDKIYVTEITSLPSAGILITIPSSQELNVVGTTIAYLIDDSSGAAIYEFTNDEITLQAGTIFSSKVDSSASANFIINAGAGISGSTTGQNLNLSAGAGYGSGATVGGNINLASGAPNGGGAEGAINIQTRSGGKIGFFNGTAVVRQAGLTAITHTSPGTPDYAIQDLTNAGGFGFATKDEGNTVLSVIKAMHDAMKNYNLLT